MENDVARHFSPSNEMRNLSVVKVTYRESYRTVYEITKNLLLPNNNAILFAIVSSWG